MTTAEQIKSDTLTLLLAYRIHQALPTTARMMKVRQCCERLMEKTDDELMLKAYCKLIRSIYAHDFTAALVWLHITETNYAKVYNV